MTGLLLGILLSRVVAGFVAETAGWRAMFALAAVSGVAVIGVVAAQAAHFADHARLPYRALIGSLGRLWRQHPALRRAALARRGCWPSGFSAFWSTLAVMLHGAPFHLGSAAAARSGSPVRLVRWPRRLPADHHDPERVTRLGIGIATVSFASMAAAPLMSAHAQLVLLAVATIGFDLGVQATLIAPRQSSTGSTPRRGRLNAVLFVGMFIGMAAGAAIGDLLLAQLGWNAVTGLAVVTSLAALAVRIWRR